MMKLDELMVDNWVDSIYGEQCILDIQTTQNQIITDYSQIFLSEEIDPIKLSEEWLLNFGAGKTEFANYPTIFNLPKMNVYKDHIGFRLLSSLDRRIKYVHELQNLYYLLTQEKLKLNKLDI